VKAAFVILIAVAPARTAVAGTNDTAYVPGQTYFGRNNCIGYHAGNLPNIISVPHGAHELPAEIPDRTREDLAYHTITRELVRGSVRARAMQPPDHVLSSDD
jgi:hypothetical protein